MKQNLELNLRVKDMSLPTKRSKVSEAEIFEILKEGETGISLDEVCRKHEISRSAYYRASPK